MTGASDQQADWRRTPPVQAALSNRCPRCGQGAILSGYLEPNHFCGHCGLDFTKHAAGDGAPFIVLTVLCFFAVGLVAWLELSYEPPGWVHAVVVLPLVFMVGGPLLPIVKRFVIAQSVWAALLSADADARAHEASGDD